MSTLNPVGGINQVVLYPAGDVLEVISTADNLTIVGVDGSSPILITPMEQSSLVTLEVKSGIEALSVVHRLKISIEECFAEEILTPEFLIQAAYRGFVAQVTTLSGKTVVLGWSRKFGAAAPLRLEGLESSSCEKRIQSPYSILTLVSKDDSLPLSNSNNK